MILDDHSERVEAILARHADDTYRGVARRDIGFLLDLVERQSNQLDEIARRDRAPVYATPVIRPAVDELVPKRIPRIIREPRPALGWADIAFATFIGLALLTAIVGTLLVRFA